MKAGVGAFLFLIYSFAIFMGTPVPLLILQAFALLVVVAVVVEIAIRRRTMIFSPKFLIFFLVSVLFFIESMIVGLESAQTPISVMMRFLQVFFITFAVPLLGYSLVSLGLMTRERLLRNIVYAIIAYACMKVAIVALIAAFNIPQIVVVKVFQFVFNADPAFGIFFLNIARFFTPTDFLSAFALYYCLFFWTGRWRVIWILLLCASIFISYSRFVWLEGIFTLALYSLKLSRGQVLALLLGLIAVAPLATLVPVTLIEQRFFSSAAEKSDIVRSTETEALTQDMDQNFLFGHGFGSFSYKDVRDKLAPYSYEEQWLAITYELGVVGLLIVLGLLTCTIAPVLETPTLEGIPLILLFVFSLLSGFANPSLIGRTAGMGFAFVYFCASAIRDRANCDATRGGKDPNAEPFSGASVPAG